MQYSGGQRIQPQQMIGGEGLGADGVGPGPERSPPQRHGVRCERHQIDGAPGLPDIGKHPGRQVVQRLQVLGQHRRGPGQGGGHSPTQYVLEQGQHLATQPYPGEAFVGKRELAMLQRDR